MLIKLLLPLLLHNIYIARFFPDVVEAEVKELILDIKYPATKKQVIGREEFYSAE